jgi:uncharacterized protein
VIGFCRRPHDREAPIQRGLAAYQRADYTTALEEWSAAAANCDPEALYQLGLLYARGHGVLANLADAAHYYLQAAKQGHAEAQYQLGLLHFGGTRGDQSSGCAKWHGAAALQNRKLLFPNGLDVPLDSSEALRWSRAAAEQGMAKAQAVTGLIYARGFGCERDYLEARRWYLLAAAQGNAAAELGLGVLYANGLGVETDLVTAASWYEKAAEKGNDGRRRRSR